MSDNKIKENEDNQRYNHRRTYALYVKLAVNQFEKTGLLDK